MQPPPAQAAEPPDHAVGRGRGQCRQAEPGRAANNEIPAMRDLISRLAEAVALVGEKQREMCGDIAKRSDAEHTPHIDQIAVARDAPEWRHRQRHAKKYQRPETGAVDQIVERARTVRDRLHVDQRFGERQQQQRQCHHTKRPKPSAPVAPDFPRMSHRSRLPQRRLPVIVRCTSLPSGYTGLC